MECVLINHKRMAVVIASGASLLSHLLTGPYVHHALHDSDGGGQGTSFSDATFSSHGSFVIGGEGEAMRDDSALQCNYGKPRLNGMSNLIRHTKQARVESQVVAGGCSRADVGHDGE